MRTRLIVLSCIVLLPVLAVLVHQTVERRQVSMAAAEHQAELLAREIATEQEERMLHGGDQLLRVVAALPDVLRHDPRGCSALLADLARLYHGYAELGAATLDGDIFCSTRGPQPMHRGIANRSYFRRAVTTSGFAAGGFEIGRITGRPIIVLMRAAVDRAGQPRAVVFAGVDLARVNLAPSGGTLPAGAVVTVIDRSGRILGRYPGADSARGTLFEDATLLRTVLARRTGKFEAEDRDGVQRLYAFAPIRTLDGADSASAIVAVPASGVHGGADWTLGHNVIALVAAGLAALLLGWIGADVLLLRGMRGLLTATKRLAAGDLRAEHDLPSGDSELAQLSRVFAGMAQTLESRSMAIEAARAAHRATATALESEHRFVTAVLDVIGALVVVLDCDGRILRFNHACERITGYAATEVQGRVFWDVFLPRDDAAGARAAFDRFRAAGVPASHERAWITKDGRQCVIAWSNTLLAAPDGSVEYVIATGIDVTDRKRAEDELRKSEATAHAFLESAAEGVVIADDDGRIVLVNAEIEAIFGYARDELLGRPVETLLPERLAATHVEHRAGYVQHPVPGVMSVDRPCIGRKRDGTEVPIEMKLSSIVTEDGVRVMVFVTDITERLALQRQARQTEKLTALGTLSAGIAHEVNNPIGIITSRTELMLGEPDLPSIIADDVRTVHRHAQRVAKIVTGLLSFARQSPGTQAPVALNQVVEDTVALVGAQMRKDRIKLRAALDPDLPTILGDGNALEQVVLNLLTNARDAIGTDGEISITTEPAPQRTGWVRVVIADTGPGMPSDVIPKIFDPFFTTKTSGTGLGLSLTYGIVRDHQGTIDVESKVGVGTTFVLSFPIAEASWSVRVAAAGRAEIRRP